jgi:hypothetical protein
MNLQALTFDDLKKPIDFQLFEAPTLGDIDGFIENAESIWNMSDEDAQSHDSDGTILFSHIVKIAKIDDMQTLEYDQVKLQFIQLRLIAANLSRMMSRYPALREDEGILNRLRRFEKSTIRAEQVIQDMVALNHSLDSLDMTRFDSLPPHIEGEKEYVDFSEEDCKTTYQKFLYFMIQDLECRQYKRCGDTLLKYKNVTQCVITGTGERVMIERKSMAYERVSSIGEYIDSIASFDVNKKLWSCMTSAVGNKKAAIEYFKECKLVCLQDIHENHHLRSFGGKDGIGAGIYDQDSDTYWEYGMEDEWEEQAQRIQEARRKYDPEYVCKAPAINDVALRHFDDAFEGAANLWNIDETNGVPEATPRESERQWWGIDPMSIPTPELDKILEDQGIDTEEDKFWVYAKCGRNLYFVKEKDSHENIFYIFGKGGTGKSVLLTYVAGFFPDHRVAMMNSNMQSDFGTSTLKDAFFVISTEVQEDFKFPENDFKAACSGERIMANKKHEEPIDINPWIAHMMFAGNHLFKTYNDNGGQLLRRVDGIKFDTQIDDKDPTIFATMESKRFLYLRKMNLCYLKWIHELNGKIPKKTREHMPPAFWKFASFVKTQMNPLSAMLESEYKLEFDSSYAMPFSEIRNLYKEFINEFQVPKHQSRQINFQEESTYMDAFRQRKCERRKQEIFDETLGQKRVEDLMIGCRIKTLD